MNGISLFTGGGIGELALRNIIPGYKTVCYVEWDKYCQEIIQARIRDGVLDDAPIWDDVRTFDGRRWTEKVDFISGGFPCQPFSVAGKNTGVDDSKNMWPDTIRIISEVRPRYAFLENVPNLLTHEYAKRIFADLASIGYDCEWDVVSAAFVGAPHTRNRIWMLAYSKCSRNNRIQYEEKQCDQKRNNQWTSINFREMVDIAGYRTPKICELRGTDYGLANPMDRLKTIGNGWVPWVVERILQVTHGRQ